MWLNCRRLEDGAILTQRSTGIDRGNSSTRTEDSFSADTDLSATRAILSTLAADANGRAAMETAPRRVLARAILYRSLATSGRAVRARMPSWRPLRPTLTRR